MRPRTVGQEVCDRFRIRFWHRQSWSCNKKESQHHLGQHLERILCCLSNWGPGTGELVAWRDFIGEQVHPREEKRERRGNACRLDNWATHRWKPLLTLDANFAVFSELPIETVRPGFNDFLMLGCVQPGLERSWSWCTTKPQDRNHTFL